MASSTASSAPAATTSPSATFRTAPGARAWARARQRGPRQRPSGRGGRRHHFGLQRPPAEAPAAMFWQHPAARAGLLPPSACAPLAGHLGPLGQRAQQREVGGHAVDAALRPARAASGAARRQSCRRACTMSLASRCRSAARAWPATPCVSTRTPGPAGRSKRAAARCPAVAPALRIQRFGVDAPLDGMALHGGGCAAGPGPGVPGELAGGQPQSAPAPGPRPVTSSVMVCSTCRRGLASMNT
jgi:hypothetical protein